MSNVVPADIELPRSASSPPDNLDALDDDALDQLPFGVVGVDVDGRILRFNLAEARLARLDRESVLGLSFFQRVAPCTSTDAFEGRFRTFIENAVFDHVHFPYVFDFKFGAQDVDVELVRGGTRAAVYFLINRMRFHGARPDAPKVAATLAELRPGEDQRGVRRDDASFQRHAMMPLTFFSALKSTWDRVAPDGGPAFSVAWGETWGRLVVIELDMACVESEGKNLRELPTRTALSRIADDIAARGLGHVSVDFAQAKAGIVAVHVERSVFAEAAGTSRLPRCALLSGVLQAVFSHLSQKKLHVRECCCSSQGHDRCTFFVVGDARRARLMELSQKQNVVDLKSAADALACLVAP
jgi:photoactive yellow protein